MFLQRCCNILRQCSVAVECYLIQWLRGSATLQHYVTYIRERMDYDICYIMVSVCIPVLQWRSVAEYYITLPIQWVTIMWVTWGCVAARSTPDSTTSIWGSIDRKPDLRGPRDEEAMYIMTSRMGKRPPRGVLHKSKQKQLLHLRVNFQFYDDFLISYSN